MCFTAVFYVYYKQLNTLCDLWFYCLVHIYICIWLYSSSTGSATCLKNFHKAWQLKYPGSIKFAFHDWTNFSKILHIWTFIYIWHNIKCRSGQFSIPSHVLKISLDLTTLYIVQFILFVFHSVSWTMSYWITSLCWEIRIKMYIIFYHCILIILSVSTLSVSNQHMACEFLHMVQCRKYVH